MEQLTVGASADLINDGGLQIDEDGTRNVLAGTSFCITEKNDCNRILSQKIKNVFPRQTM